MTQEEKAKAYDEAIKRAEKALEVYGTDKCEGARQIFSLFPELKESEDEKIRKEILEVAETVVSSDGTLYGKKYNCREWIAWLEKQGATNETINRDEFTQGVLRGAAINLITWIDYNSAEGNMCLSNMECKNIEDALVSGDWNKIYAYIKKKLEKQGEQKSLRMVSAEAKEAMYSKPTDLEVFINELSKQFPDVSFAKLSRIAVRVAKWAKPTDEEMKELLRTEYEKGRADTIAEMQKSTWSEEDEKRFKSCLNILQAKGLIGVVETINTKWLKSLKERVQLKQEWSEEDECYMTECVNAIATKDGWSFEEKRKMKHWLKSLKERL